LIEYLNKNLLGAVDDSVVFSNPVKDFIFLNKIESLDRIFHDDKISINMDNSESGFLDFLAEIEEDTQTLTENIVKMTNDIETLGAGADKSTGEFKRVSINGGNSVATFVRKEARKIAGLINNFDKNMKGYNIQYTTLWDKIEKNVLGFLENKYSSSKENTENMANYLRGLHGMQLSIIKSNENVEGFKNTLNSLKGLERALTQYIKFVDDELKEYLDIMSRIYASIDRIKDKSKFVVGAIDFEKTQQEQLSLA
jgi:hypothetical protein